MDPVITLALIGATVATITTGINKLMVDQDRLDEIRKRIKEIQKEMKEEEGKHPQKQKEMMKLSKEMMFNSFKPMLITIIPMLLLILYLKGLYDGTGVVVTLPVVNIGLTWIWWYILIAMIVSLSIEAVYRTWRKKKKEG